MLSLSARPLPSCGVMIASAPPHRGLNRLLLETDELIAPVSETGCGHLRAYLGSKDPRTQHLRAVLKLGSGGRIRAGVIDRGSDDHAMIHWRGSEDGGDEVRLDEAALQVAAPRPRVDILLAMPPPSRFHRTLPLFGMLGVNHVHLTNAGKVDKAYFASHMLRTDAHANVSLREALRLGLEQSGGVAMPRVTVGHPLP